jgi:NAD(P)-dependent dehydrogenase (short-subunit alcohol dehydrogenase family)
MGTLAGCIAIVTGKSPGPGTLISYSVAKAALHRLNTDLATELAGSGAVVLAIWPPASRTEGVLAQAEVFGGVDHWREPVFTGRVVAALAASGDLSDRAGQALVVTDLATELGVA